MLAEPNKSRNFTLATYLVLMLFLFVDKINYAQVDTLKSFEVTVVPTQLQEWYFTDTLIDQLIRNDAFLSWKKITVVDQIYPNHLTNYSLTPSGNKVKIIDSSGVEIRNISKKKINKLLEALVNEIKISDSIYMDYNPYNDPLSKYQLDSIWYKKEILNLWEKYRSLESIIIDSNQIKIATKALLDYPALKRTLCNPKNFNQQEGVMIDFQIEYAHGTVHLQATSYFAFALPWFYFNNQTRLDESRISKTIGNILGIINPKSPNLDRLQGADFEMKLLEDIYLQYLKAKLGNH